MPNVYTSDEVDGMISKLDKRITALEHPVPPPIDPPPIDPPPTPTERKLLGGWRVMEAFSQRSPFAVNWAAPTIYTVSLERGGVTYSTLPPMGAGTDSSQWPIVNHETGGTNIKQWWPKEDGYAYGLAYFDNDLWASPRYFYATSDHEINGPVKWYARSGKVMEFAEPRQRFAGFVKSLPGTIPLSGGGGLESGQGWSSGPTLVGLGSIKRFEFSQGGDWETRCPRDPDYAPAGPDSWVALAPRDGKGAWASDVVYGGGLLIGGVAHFWPRLGVGRIDYASQAECLAADGTMKTCEYRFEAATGKLLGWNTMSIGRVSGQEMDADGRIYLYESDAWTSDRYQNQPLLRCYGA